MVFYIHANYMSECMKHNILKSDKKIHGYNAEKKLYLKLRQK